MTLLERIEKALDDFTKGRASMHVPPLDTDVDMVLAECATTLSKMQQIGYLFINSDGQTLFSISGNPCEGFDLIGPVYGEVLP